MKKAKRTAAQAFARRPYAPPGLRPVSLLGCERLLAGSTPDQMTRRKTDPVDEEEWDDGLVLSRPYFY